MFVVSFTSGSYEDRRDVHCVVDGEESRERTIMGMIASYRLHNYLLSKRRKDEFGRTWIVADDDQEIWLTYLPY